MRNSISRPGQSRINSNPLPRRASEAKDSRNHSRPPVIRVASAGKVPSGVRGACPLSNRRARYPIGVPSNSSAWDAGCENQRATQQAEPQIGTEKGRICENRMVTQQPRPQITREKVLTCENQPVTQRPQPQPGHKTAAIREEPPVTHTTTSRRRCDHGQEPTQRRQHAT